MKTASSVSSLRQRIPGASIISMRRDPLGWFTRMQRDHGDFVRFSLGAQEMFLVSDPEMIGAILVRDHRNFTKGRGLQLAKALLGEGLLTSEGEFHRRQRRLVQPAFHRQRLGGYADTMTQYAARAGNRWHDGEQRDLAEEMTRLTLAIVGKTLFNADVENEASEIGAALNETMGLFAYMSLPFAQHLLKLPLPQVRRFERGRNRLNETIYRLIADHRNGEDQGDLLSMLLLAQDEGEEQAEARNMQAGAEIGTAGKSGTAQNGAMMTDAQVRDEAITLFLAGHETTANAMAWTWYLLALNPDIEARFHAEIDAALSGQMPTFDDVARLPYTRRVLAESLRLYPPAWLVARRALSDYTFEGCHIPARSIAVFSQWVSHRDPRWWPEPDRFDPERWLPEVAATRPKFAYYPFGSGPRVCIGEQFAWSEGILILATLGQKWQMRLAPGATVGMAPGITLRPRPGMPMTLHRRNSNAI